MEEDPKRLLAVVRDAGHPPEARGRAAISLGPVLEECDIEGFDAEFSEPPIDEPAYREIQDTLRAVHDDPAQPKEVRRRALEASVRAPQEWHAEAIRAAYANPDREWRITAVFAMQYVRGFDREILASLEDPDPEIRFEAIRSAGGAEVKAAWPKIQAMLTPETDRDLLLAAIEAAPNIAPKEALPILADLSDSDDEEIAEAASDAMMDATSEIYD